MSRRSSFRAALMLAAALSATACSKIESAVKGVTGKSAPAPFDKARLDAAVDKLMGGPATCVIMLDAKTGSEAYRYDYNGSCERELPPCSTFHIAAALVALDQGTLPSTLFKWDHTPQPAKAWERDVDLTTAFKQSIDWVFQQLARKTGAAVYDAQLKALGYGNHAVTGPIDAFWQGPQAGGALAISTRGQARFLQRLYAGKLTVKPESSAFVTASMVDEIRGGSTVSGRMGTCASVGDGSRQVGWWIGRVQGPKSDFVFAASIEDQNALPGLEIQTRLKNAFAQGGVWPDMP